MKINEAIYRVTAVGSVATANLKQLGHITLNFDGAATLNYRGWYICGNHHMIFSVATKYLSIRI
jgi:PTS system glucitol/sorbitol-specific IIA component